MVPLVRYMFALPPIAVLRGEGGCELHVVRLALQSLYRMVPQWCNAHAQQTMLQEQAGCVSTVDGGALQ